MAQINLIFFWGGQVMGYAPSKPDTQIGCQSVRKWSGFIQNGRKFLYK